MDKTAASTIGSKQWSFAAWLIHFDQICKLYELNKNKGSEHLITYYEDRFRCHLHRLCESGRIVDLETECGKINETIMDECKIKLESVLQSAGLRDSPTQASASQVKQADPAPSAFAKQQASFEAERKKHTVEVNAFNQRQAAHQRKVQALKDSQPKKSFVYSKFNKGWQSNSSKGQSKGQNQYQHKQQPKSCNNGKGKSKGQRG